ncbi:MAG: MbnH family di-heme enzyme [Arachnia sp.]
MRPFVRTARSAGRGAFVVPLLILVAVAATTTVLLPRADAPAETAALRPAALDAFRWPMPAWMPPPPVPDDIEMTPDLVELGRHLFYDARLSVDGTIACASCHQQELAFTDGRTTALGARSTLGHRNSPSLANVGYMPTLTWINPHFTTLEFQALTPMFGTEPVEMGLAGQEEALFGRLAADPYYAGAFPVAFPDRPMPDLYTITRALGAFQRTMISLNSPYDRATYYGEAEAMTEAARRGQALFFDHRLECYHCHTGALFSDNLETARTPFPENAYHNTGLYNLDGAGAYPAGGLGLYEFTGVDADMGRFRTPSLRNVAVTAPYMHDGSIATLEEVIRHYAAGGRSITDGPHAGIGHENPYRDGLIVGFEISDAEIADLTAFLESLTDRDFLTDPAFADPWPDGHPASANRVMPLN